MPGLRLIHVSKMGTMLFYLVYMVSLRLYVSSFLYDILVFDQWIFWLDIPYDPDEWNKHDFEVYDMLGVS